ncbi:MAG: glycosyltransferase family 1 protein [Inquilinus sp.]|nr:glycosyltransferase family 1 protein [Inquilinus sp.]
MGLNYSRRNDCYMYSSDRLWQLAGNGLLTVTPRVPGMDRLFTEDEVVYFDSVDDLVDSVHRFHRDGGARRRVAEAGWRRAQQSFDTKRVANYMIETIYRTPFTEPYEWADQVL